MNSYSERNAEFHPRVIVWSLARVDDQTGFSTHECLLTIDGIARYAKPIIVLTGSNLLQRPDLYEIIEYGNALGLRIIVETQPKELTSEVLHLYAAFGPKLFRLILNGCVVEDSETRYKQSSEFLALRDAIQRLNTAGYEIHLGAMIDHVDIRELAFYHDFAFRSAANGLYCHLSFNASDNNEEKHENTNEVIDAFARMKRFSPKNMYVSPQCVKYGPRRFVDEMHDDQNSVCEYSWEWAHCCLGGKSFAHINSEGIIQICAGQPQVCGDLRANGYDFKQAWEHSEMFQFLRSNEWTCAETLSHVNSIQET